MLLVDVCGWMRHLSHCSLGICMDYNDINVDLPASAVRLKGPAAFMTAIDWDAVEQIALSLCPEMAPEQAVHEAVWRHYAGWWEEQHRHRRR